MMFKSLLSTPSIAGISASRSPWRPSGPATISNGMRKANAKKSDETAVKKMKRPVSGEGEAREEEA